MRVLFPRSCVRLHRSLEHPHQSELLLVTPASVLTVDQEHNGALGREQAESKTAPPSSSLDGGPYLS
jgi:hypothetical protein